MPAKAATRRAPSTRKSSSGRKTVRRRDSNPGLMNQASNKAGSGQGKAKN